MRILANVNKVLKTLNNADFHGNVVFSATKSKRLGDWYIEAYEIESTGELKINLYYHKIAQAVATFYDVGMMICVDVDRRPYYYFY